MDLEDQLLNAEGFAAAAQEAAALPGPWVDLGSGGGVPGLVLAIRLPTVPFVLVDAQLRRTQFLASSVSGLEVGDRVGVVRSRAEELGRDPSYRGAYSVVTSRSFGPAAVTAECAAPLLRVGGVLVVSEPPDGEPAARWPADGLAVLGLEPVRRTRFADRFSYQVLLQVAPCPERYPRRVGVPAKRPLF